MDTPLFVPVEDVPPAPLTLRVSRRQLVIRLLCALGTGVLAAVAWRPLYLTWLPAVLGVSFSAQLGGLVRSATGTIHIGPDGLRVRRLGITRRIPWSTILNCGVRTGALGRRVQIARTGARRLRLPVPVSPYLIPDPDFDPHINALARQFAAYRNAGAPPVIASGPSRRPWFLAVTAAVLVVALLFDQPWGWLPGPRAITLPDPCPLAAGHAAAMVRGVTMQSGAVAEAAATHGRYCDWELAVNRYLSVEVEQYDRLGAHSGTWRATVDYAQARHNLEGQQIPALPRIGDEAIAIENHLGAAIITRRGNVVITVVAFGHLPGYDRADMLAIATAVAAAVTTR